VAAEVAVGPSVLLAGGGTAGHTSPLLATAVALRELAPQVQVTALGTARGIETTVIPQAGLPLELVPAVPLPRRPTPELLSVPARVGASVVAALRILDRLRPDVVVGFGGYVCIPAYLAARRHGIPLVVHEGNALPGLANRLGARLTPHVATSFPDTPLPRARFIGMPIRRLVSQLDRDAMREPARRELGLDADRLTLLVTGGSQGARRLNQVVSAAAGELGSAGVQVLHVAGRHGGVDVRPQPGAPPYVVVPFLERIDLGYAAADLVLCRAGASTVTEVAAVGLPAVFVPLPIGNGEQARNAAPLVAAGGALLVDDAALSPQWVAEMVPGLIGDRDRLAQMSKAAAELLPADADVALARLVLGVAAVGR